MANRFQIGEFWLSIPRNSGYWCVTWFDRKTRQTRRRSLRTKDFDRAKELLAEHHIKHRTLKKASPDSVSLGEILGRYYEGHAAHLKSSDAAKNAIKRILTHSPGITVAEFNHETQERFISHLREEGLTNGTITRYMVVIRAALNYAYKRDQLDRVPFVMTAGQGGKRERILTLEEAAALWNAVDREHVGMYLMLAFTTLARPEAILELEWSQVDMRNRIINLNQEGREQTNKYRPTVPICNTLARYLVPSESPRVIGRELKSIKRQFRTIAQRAGLSGVTPYTLRHTMASELRARKVHAWELAGFMGHRIAGITETYAKYDPGYLADASRAIDAYFDELTPLLRSSCVAFTLRSREVEPVKPLKIVVGHVGFEPTTPSPPETGKPHKD